MNGMIKITLVDFDGMVYTMYANGKEEFDKCMKNLGNTKWKNTLIKTIK